MGRGAASLTLCLALGAVSPARAQTAADTAGLRQAALDYIQGWYAGDVARMEKALAPDLAKRTVTADPRSGRSVLRHLTASMMIEYTRTGGGSGTPDGGQRSTVTVLDVFGAMASVKVVSPDFVDYLHLTKWNGEWRIMNVLWEANVRDLPLSAPERARYVGSYALGQVKVNVFEQGDRLMAQATGQPALGLRYQGSHQFVAAVPEDIRFTFEVEGDRAAAFVLRQGGQTIRALRVP